MNLKYSVNIRTKRSICHGRPDLTPLIDVLFLVLIFVMLSSSFIKISGITVELPVVDSNRLQSVERFVVSIDRHSNIYFRDKAIDWKGLKQGLVDVSSATDHATIILRSDSRAPFGVVARVMALAEEAGLSVFVATVAPEDPKSRASSYVDER
ncbi:MAG: biopolymer transporter ExbD [Victivallales bacterium]|nr:biopolymer transporter ExbD [Victivallales bacterium]